MISIERVHFAPEAGAPARHSPVVEWVARGTQAVIVALPFVLVIVAWFGGRHAVVWMAGILLTATALERIGVAILRRLVGREWRQVPAGRLPKTWTLDESGITISDGVATYIVRWEAIIAVREERRRFLFYVGPGTAYRLPIRFLDAGRNQIADIRALIAEVTASGRLGRGVD